MRLVAVGGPLLGGLIVGAYGVAAAFWTQTLLSGLAAVLVAVAMARPSGERSLTRTKSGSRCGTAVCTPAARRALAFAAPTAFALAFARAARSLLLPLRASELGLSDIAIGGVVSVSFALDGLLFPLAGLLMDRWGRKWAGVPSLTGYTLAFAVMATAQGPASVWGAGALMGMSNGISAGFLMVLGADLAPEGARSQFIGLWKSVTAAGQMVAPLMIGVISTRAGGLGAATTAVAVVTASGALWYACIGIETLQRAPPPRSSSDSGFELASLADDDSHAEAAEAAGEAEEAGEAGAASAHDQGEMCGSPANV